MNHPPPHLRHTRPARPSHRRRAAISGRSAVILGPVILLSVMLLAYSIIAQMNARAQNAWYAFARSVRNAGEPLLFEDLDRLRPVIPDSQNGALVITAIANQLYQASPPSDSSVIMFESRPDYTSAQPLTIPRDTLEDTRAHLSNHRPLLVALKQLGRCRQGRSVGLYQDWSDDPYSMMLPTLGAHRNAAKLLCADAIVHGLDGCANESAESLRLSFRAGTALDGNWTLIENHVRGSIYRITVNAINTVLLAESFSDESLKMLEEEIAFAERHDGLSDGLRMERALFVQTCDAIASGKNSAAILSCVNRGTTISPNRGTTISPAVFSVLGKTGERYIRMNQRLGHDLYTRIINKQTMRERLAEAQRIEMAFPTLAPQTSLSTAIVAMLFYPSSSSIQLHMTNKAKLRCAQAALAMERYRLAHGAFPDNLDDLVPDFLDAVPIDPFDGKPIRLVRTPRDLVIYSIGKNETDDGGDLVFAKKKGGRPDIGFRLRLPEYRGFVIEEPPSDESTGGKRRKGETHHPTSDATPRPARADTDQPPAK